MRQRLSFHATGRRFFFLHSAVLLLFTLAPPAPGASGTRPTAGAEEIVPENLLTQIAAAGTPRGNGFRRQGKGNGPRNIESNPASLPPPAEMIGLSTNAVTLPGSTGTNSDNPILIVTNSANPFSSYYSEILATEGLNAFALRNLSFVSGTNLAPYDVIVLGETTLTPPQVNTLSNWVASGGNLIAMRPDKKLARLLGLADSGATLAESYLRVNTARNGPGAGIVGETIQFHGTADLYTLTGASNVAMVYSNANTATPHPAVTLRSVGAKGGQAAAFTFDLARSVVYTRQGNPAWAGQDRDGQPPVRSDDLFFGGAIFDPQPDWVDLSKVAIPQADEQQRLLANLILFMNSDKKLLPRFWYFPHGRQAVVVMTGDDHGTGGTAARFNTYMSYSSTNASVADWEAVRSSSYIYPFSPLTDEQAAAYHAAGFDIGLHLNTGCADYTQESLEVLLGQQLSEFESLYPGIPRPTTHRVHCIAWSGYTILPEVESLFGIRLNTTCYYWPSNWVADTPGMFTGSGMPMRFATADGSLIDVYQAATQMTDESGQSYPFTCDTLLDRALGPEGYYGAFVANMHTDLDNIPQSDAIIASAMARGVPVISARQLLTWVDARNASSFSSIIWSNNSQFFSVQADASAVGLQVMTPVPAGYRIGEVRFNGSPIPYYLSEVKGFHYAFAAAQTGDYRVSYVPDTTPPLISSVNPSQDSSGASPRNAVRVGFNEDMNEFSFPGSTFTLLNSIGAPVPAVVTYDPSTFSAVLTPNNPLNEFETHTARMRGGPSGAKDLAGNHLANDFVWSFTTGPAVIPISIWSNSATPAILSAEDPNPVELGVKFRTASAGLITAIRFYKGPHNIGPREGKLWSESGDLLGSVTFANESSSGWQQQDLPAPIPINSNTTYVVSYNAPAGMYSADIGYFATSGVTNGPLRALRDGESGGNGVFTYTPNTFPGQTWNSANYWVDIVFQENP